jgi:hypothetical protein
VVGMNNPYGLGGLPPGWDQYFQQIQIAEQREQGIKRLADHLNKGFKGQNPQQLGMMLMAMSQMNPEDLVLLLGMLKPEVMEQLMEATSQTAFQPKSAPPVGGGFNGAGAQNSGAPAGPGQRSTAGVQGAPNVQGAKNLTPEQKKNAQIIIEEGRKMGASDRDIQIALMTAMQESSLRNLSGGDRDSAGLFQQRPSQGWGSFAQVTDPHYSAQTFYKHLLAVKNRDSMPLTQAAQTVQRSAYPDAYAKWQGLAAGLMQELGGGGGMIA